MFYIITCVYRKSFQSLEQLSADMSLSQMSLDPAQLNPHSLDGKAGLTHWHREGLWCVCFIMSQLWWHHSLITSSYIDDVISQWKGPYTTWGKIPAPLPQYLSESHEKKETIFWSIKHIWGQLRFFALWH